MGIKTDNQGQWAKDLLEDNILQRVLYKLVSARRLGGISVELPIQAGSLAPQNIRVSRSL